MLDTKSLTLRYLTNGGTGDRWALCTDDAALAKAGLPAYSSSLHRYICVPASGEKTLFVAVTPGTPAERSHGGGAARGRNARGHGQLEHSRESRRRADDGLPARAIVLRGVRGRVVLRPNQSLPRPGLRPSRSSPWPQGRGFRTESQRRVPATG